MTKVKGLFTPNHSKFKRITQHNYNVNGTEEQYC